MLVANLIISFAIALWFSIPTIRVTWPPVTMRAMCAYGTLTLQLRKLFIMNTKIEYGMLPTTQLIPQCMCLDQMTALVGKMYPQCYYYYVKIIL